MDDGSAASSGTAYDSHKSVHAVAPDVRERCVVCDEPASDAVPHLRLCVDHLRVVAATKFARPADEPVVTNPTDHAPVVYYVRFGDRVKIGTTRNLRNRLLGLPHDELLATEPGSYDVEKRRHRQFATFRVSPRSEWFHHHPALAEHIATLT